MGYVRILTTIFVSTVLGCACGRRDSATESPPHANAPGDNPSLATTSGPDAPTVGETSVLGPFVGLGAEPHPDNVSPNPVRFNGTDLGWSYFHDGKLEFLFGDTVADDTWARIEPETNGLHDDVIGTIDLAQWPDPRLITASNIPPMRLLQNPDSGELLGIDPGFAMDDLKTPEAGFSNGKREFGLFILSKPLGCTEDADCGSELSCAPELGYVGPPYTEEAGLTLGCTEGRPGCTADTMSNPDGSPVPGSGLCVDHRSSVWQDTPAGRFAAVAMTQRIAVRSTTERNRYQGIHDWLTNKFINTAMRAVRRFEPERGPSRAEQDYRPADSANTAQQVLLWGRPGFTGVGARGRPENLYFAYADMPLAPGFEWSPRFFTGVDDSGMPRFSPHEREAVALDLDAATPGVQPDEVNDIIQHMSVVWMEPLQKWVMFYGGGIDVTPLPDWGLGECGILEVFAGSDCKAVVLGQGSIYMRSADKPWGPWSAPQEIIAGGDPTVPGSGQYGPGGMLYHPGCQGPACAPHHSFPELDPKANYGWFYGANIIEQWIVPAGDGVDVLWNASTYDPYRVILLRTHISR